MYKPIDMPEKFEAFFEPFPVRFHQFGEYYIVPKDDFDKLLQVAGFFINVDVEETATRDYDTSMSVDDFLAELSSKEAEECPAPNDCPGCEEQIKLGKDCPLGEACLPKKKKQKESYRE